MSQNATTPATEKKAPDQLSATEIIDTIEHLRTEGNYAQSMINLTQHMLNDGNESIENLMAKEYFCCEGLSYLTRIFDNIFCYLDELVKVVDGGVA